MTALLFVLALLLIRVVLPVALLLLVGETLKHRNMRVMGAL